MRVSSFIYEIFRKFPFLLIANTLLVISVSLFGACSLLTLSPVIDLLVHPELQGASVLTIKAIGVLKFFGLSITLGNWLIIFVVFIALASAFQAFARYSILKTVYAVARGIEFETFRDFFNAQWYFFTSSKQGVLLNTLNRECVVVTTAFTAIAFLFAYSMQLIFFLAVPFYLSWQVTIISLGTAFLFAWPFLLLGKRSYRLGLLSTSTANQFSSVVQENISLAKLVLGFGNQKRSIDDLDRVFDAHRWAAIKSQIITAVIPILYRPFGVIMIVIALSTARWFKVPLSETTVLLLALSQVALSISNLTMQKNSLQNFSPSYEQIKALRLYATQLKQKSGSRKFNGFVRELKIERLSFVYPRQEHPALEDINVRIPKGKMVAFVGKSGSGKSTLIDMIMGFYEPTTGQIMFDDLPLQEFNIISYRQQLGYVPQDSVLFNMSIRDNLRWAKEDVTDEEIKQACRQANADEFIEGFPQGYDTLVGDRGVRLSGGQTQCIALARAILRRPDILILDEATSSLDTHSERLIQEAIESIAKETTVIIIAHRLSTVVNADYIYVLKKGRIVEEGTYSELICKNSEFQRMAKLQVLQTAG